MTTQQTDIEKTLKRILARELKEWPIHAEEIWQQMDGSVFYEDVAGDTWGIGLFSTSEGDFGDAVTRAQWEAERALLASEQAQPLGDSEEFDQALWDKVAASVAPAIYTDAMSEFAKTGCPCEDWRDYVASDICNMADAFMAERAKRIAARKAGHD